MVDEVHQWISKSIHMILPKSSSLIVSITGHSYPSTSIFTKRDKSLTFPGFNALTNAVPVAGSLFRLS